jgi:hypothetical protein
MTQFVEILPLGQSVPAVETPDRQEDWHGPPGRRPASQKDADTEEAASVSENPAPFSWPRVLPGL